MTETKICTKCKVEKNLDEFYVKKDKYKDKVYITLRHACIPCLNVIRKKHYINNREIELSKNAQWVEGNKDKHDAYLKSYYQRHKDDYNRRCKEWSKDHPEYIRHRGAIRRSLIKQRLPKFANIEKIKSIYNEAVKMTKETGMIYHVDHIVPLQGKKVSGLHVHYNLQILSAEDNITKSNKFDV